MVGASTSARPGRRAGAVSRGGRSGRRNPIVADGGGSSVVPRPSADAKRNKITVIVITPRRHCRRLRRKACACRSVALGPQTRCGRCYCATTLRHNASRPARHPVN